MKKVLIFFGVVSAFLSIDVYSEHITIEENRIWGNTYFVDGKRLESWLVREELRKVMIDSPDAVEELDTSIVYGMSSVLMMVSGVAMVGEQVVDLASGENPSVTIALAGAGFLKLGMWLREKKEQKYQKAIDFFHAGNSPANTNKSNNVNEKRRESDRKKKGANNEFQFDVSPRQLTLSYSFY